MKNPSAVALGRLGGQAKPRETPSSEYLKVAGEVQEWIKQRKD